MSVIFGEFMTEQTHIEKFYVFKNIILETDKERSIYADVWLLGDTSEQFSGEEELITENAYNYKGLGPIQKKRTFGIQEFKKMKHILTGWARIFIF
jgi:hypothetical protein